MKEIYSEQEKFISKLLIFVFVFIVIVITVLSLHYAGIFRSRNDTKNTTSGADPLQTTDTSASPSQSSTPESTSGITPDSTTESTSSSTKYQPATVPSIIPSQTVSTHKTSASETTVSQTTESSSATQATQPPADQPGNITAEDITNEKMEKLITKRYLSIHKNSRPGYKLWSVDDIVVHYVANPGSTADQNWRNFENNKPGTSAHFIIDLDGSIIQCMPLDEVAWAIGTTEGNYTSISIECCHPDSTGKFTDKTYESLVKLVSWLCAKFDLTEANVKRHYDYPRTNSSGVVWHKQCPIYYVNHPEEWEAFKDDLYIP